MSTNFYAIVGLTGDKPSLGGPDVLDIFEGKTVSDSFTYTMRLDIPKRQRKAIRKKLEALQENGEDTKPLLELLDKHDWDVSFLVDCY